MTDRKRPQSAMDLRSHRWFGVADLRSFGHRSRVKQMGYDRADFAGKPIIGIINTWSDLNPCHAHFKQRVEDVKRGVLQAGGFPLEFPAMALAEPFIKPTTMLYRNLLAMETEELIRANPLDGIVLLGGCDKTAPALLMGAISADLPTIFVPAGPMLRGNWRGKVLGSGSDSWKYWDEKRAGTIGETEWAEIESGIARSYGVCMTMGTAATMTALVEVLGMSLSGASSIPAADAEHPRMAAASGRRLTQMIWEDLRPSAILSSASFDNAIRALLAMGGSTNAVIHLIALARRAGIDLKLDRFDAIARQIPVIANIRPSGTYLMEDFYYAGGLRAFLGRLAGVLDLTQRTVSGASLGDDIAGASTYLDDVIRDIDHPVSSATGLAVLRGNLAPGGAIMKPSAADPRFLQHRGRAVVFDSYNDMAAAIDRDDLEISADHVLILRNAGPQGGPGMPEWGMLPIPKKLLKQGHRDMLRISDARMSGTSYGACILHVTPESFVGGPLAVVRTGDTIEVDVSRRLLQVAVSDAELARRQAGWVKPPPRLSRGYGAMYAEHIEQADLGCDFDFLSRQGQLAEPEIH
jgi:dihydroxy-acid dehydratase